MILKLKVCGMFEPVNIQAISLLKPDYMGFIFYDGSKRYVKDLSPTVLQAVDNAIQKVGVFVNTPLIEIKEMIQKYQINVVQLHGEETPETCHALRTAGVKVIKTFCVGATLDFDVLVPYLCCVDYFLFDTKSINFGGTGKSFDWAILRDYPFEQPFFLSGGLGLHNIYRLLDFIKQNPLNLVGLDVNSQFEDEKYRKIPEKIVHLQAILHQQFQNFSNTYDQKGLPT